MTPTHNHHSSFFDVMAVAALAAASLVIPNQAIAAEQPAPTAGIKNEIASSKKIGEFKGSTYYFKPAGPGIGQIFRVPNGDKPTSFAMVGLIMNGKYSSIAADEKSDFFALVTDTPASAIAAPVPAKTSAAPVAAAQPASYTQTTQPQQQTGPSDGTVVRQANGGTEVKFTQGPYTGTVMAFSRAADLITIKIPMAQQPNLVTMARRKE